MESPAGMPESPLDQDDAAYPCKGCGEVSRPKSFTPVFVYADRSSSVMQILEEGKAFELGTVTAFKCSENSSLTFLKRAIVGTSTASDATPAAPCSTPTQTFSFSVTDP